MKIIHVIDSLDPDDGGPPTVAAGLAAAQANLGHDVAILCHESPGRQQEVAAFMSRVHGIERVSVWSCPIGGALNKLTGALEKRYFEKIVNAADVVHIHGVWRPMLLEVCRSARRLGINYVVSPHGMLLPWGLRQKAWKKKIALRIAWTKALQGACFLQVLNKEEARHIESLGFGNRIKVIPNGIFPAQFEELPPAMEFYEAHPELKRRPYILFLGRLHQVKGLDILADAFSIFASTNNEVDLVVVGPDGGARADFERRIQALDLTGRVHLLGPLYGRDKVAALAGASCYCHPSRQEGFSMAITEAMARGLPVVISTSCNFPEVADAGAGKVMPLDANQIGMALLKIMEDSGLRAKMGNAAKELIFSKFTWPKIAEYTIEAYRCAPS